MGVQSSPQGGTMGNKNGKIVLTEEIVDDISKSSGMPRLDVKQQCEAFLQKHPNGMMDKKAFKKFIKMGSSPWRSFSLSSTSSLEELQRTICNGSSGYSTWTTTGPSARRS